MRAERLCQINVWPRPLGFVGSHICNRRARFAISANAVEFVKQGWVEHVCGTHKNQMVREGWTVLDSADREANQT